MNIIKQLKKTLSRLAYLTKDQDEVIFESCDFEITKREIITGVGILAIMLIIGTIISSEIHNSVLDKNREYTQALQIDSEELFRYGMQTDVGNAYVYGELNAVDTVSMPEIDGEWLWIKKVTEEYTRHERKVRHENDGRVWYETEVYYTWDCIDREEKHCKKITFLNVEFDSGKIEDPSDVYLDTQYKGWHNIRYVYYAIPASAVGTIYTKLENDTITDNTHFYQDKTIEESYESDICSYAVLLFWIGWIVLSVIIVFGFMYLDNQWLE